MAVSIGSLRYDIVADTSKFTKGIVATRSELSLARKAFNETRTPVEQYSMALEKLDKAHADGKLEAEVYRRAVDKLYSEFQQVRKPVQQLTADQDKLNKEIDEYTKKTESANRMTQKRISLFMRTQKQAKAGGGGGFMPLSPRFLSGLAIGDQVRRGAADAMAIESSIARFKVMVGSMERANTLIKELRKYDAESVFSFTDVTSVAERLLNFGVQAERIVPTIRQLGDVSAGNAERFDRLALAFGQATSLGRLQREEVNQMVEAGFNPMNEIVKVTGETMQQLSDRMKDGGVSAFELARAFETATSEGGRFFGMVQEGAKTTEGQLNIFMGKWAKFRSDFVETMLPVATGAASGGGAVLDFFNDTLPGLVMSQPGMPRTLGNTPGTMAIQSQQKQRVDREKILKAIADDEAKWREKRAERIAAIEKSKMEEAIAMNKEYEKQFRHQLELQEKEREFRGKQYKIMADAQGKIREAFKTVRGKPMEVQLAPSAQRGSKEEYQILASLTNKRGVEEAKRHAQRMEFDKRRNEILEKMRQQLEKLEMAEAV